LRTNRILAVILVLLMQLVFARLPVGALPHDTGNVSSRSHSHTEFAVETSGTITIAESKPPQPQKHNTPLKASLLALLELQAARSDVQRTLQSHQKSEIDGQPLWLLHCALLR
jgi:hypothetical protein